jgi:hypothetical protein
MTVTYNEAEFITLVQCDQNIENKYAHFLKNVAKTVAKRPTNDKISASKFNLKVQNIYTKPL